MKLSKLTIQNTRMRRACVGLMLSRRRRRWPSINPTSGELLVLVV